MQNTVWVAILATPPRMFFHRDGYILHQAGYLFISSPHLLIVVSLCALHCSRGSNPPSCAVAIFSIRSLAHSLPQAHSTILLRSVSPSFIFYTKLKKKKKKERRDTNKLRINPLNLESKAKPKHHSLGAWIYTCTQKDPNGGQFIKGRSLSPVQRLSIHVASVGGKNPTWGNMHDGLLAKY